MIVAIASGKGGTGKTTVASNLALTLCEKKRIQALDCDVEEPNLHLFLRPRLKGTESVMISVPEINQEICIRCGKCSRLCVFNALASTNNGILVFPELCHDCGGCSLICPTGATTRKQKEIGVIEWGSMGNIEFVHGKLNISSPLSPPLIKAVKGRINSHNDVIIDAPPGTSCPVINSITGVDFCLLVTEPTPFGLNDLRLAVDMTTELGIPCGVVINRSDDYDHLVEEYCQSKSVPVLLKIPFDRRYAESYASGQAIVQSYPEMKEAFLNLWAKIKRGVVNERSISY